MDIWHMNGAGNDFMVVDARGHDWDFTKLSVELCKLTGANGFMALDHSDSGDFRLHFYNSDGSRGEMCGNGARCICRFAYEKGIAGQRMVIQTDAGPVSGQRIRQSRYRVGLNIPGVLDLHRKGTIAYTELGDPGVPHAVSLYRGDLWADAQMLKDQFRRLRLDPAFPKGANVNFYTWVDEASVRILTYERGVEDFTLACGTGSGAVAAVLWAQGKLPGGVLTAQNRGGTLTVTVSGHGRRVDALFLEGPAELVKIYRI